MRFEIADFCLVNYNQNSSVTTSQSFSQFRWQKCPSDGTAMG